VSELSVCVITSNETIPGILLWEIFTLGRSPYRGIESNEDLFRKLNDGYRMEKPDFATKNVHEVMLECWQKEPSARPVSNYDKVLSLRHD
jgi:hypothetical protein